MHKNLNFERFWKGVQINFFGTGVDVHTRPHLILAPLISHINTHLVVRVEEQADNLKREPCQLLRSCSSSEAVKIWLIEVSISVLISYNWEGHLRLYQEKHFSQTDSAPLWQTWPCQRSRSHGSHSQPKGSYRFLACLWPVTTDTRVRGHLIPSSTFIIC